MFLSWLTSDYIVEELIKDVLCRKHNWQKECGCSGWHDFFTYIEDNYRYDVCINCGGDRDVG
jgi:hypothetical protein